MAATTRTSVSIVSSPPTRSKRLSWSTRRILIWTFWLISPISSRNRVPSLASSKRPFLRACAPVNEPFSCPNSSLSRSDSASAAQCTFMNGLSARGDRLCIASATSSLPTPDSPVMSTLAFVGATRRTRSNMRLMAGVFPTMVDVRRCDSTSSSSSSLRRASSRRSRARLTSMDRWSRLTGFVMKSYAPLRIASTASSTVPCPVSTMTGTDGYLDATCLKSSPPESPGMRRSVMTRSTSPRSAAWTPSLPSAANSTS